MRFVTYFFILFSLVGCSLFQKGKQYTKDEKSLGDWQLIKIQTSENQMEKDLLIFKNGIKIGQFAYQIERIDAIQAYDQVAYLLKGSPCQDCDQLKSLFIVNPKRGGSKLAFLPGRYFSGGMLEFHGRLFYGNCLPNQQSGMTNLIYLYRSTIKDPENPEVRNRKLILLNPFKNRYPSHPIDLELFSEIESSAKSMSLKCYELQQQDFTVAQ